MSLGRLLREEMLFIPLRVAAQLLLPLYRGRIMQKSPQRTFLLFKLYFDYAVFSNYFRIFGSFFYEYDHEGIQVNHRPVPIL